jgi:hypothetical protein
MSDSVPARDAVETGHLLRVVNNRCRLQGMLAGIVTKKSGSAAQRGGLQCASGAEAEAA